MLFCFWSFSVLFCPYSFFFLFSFSAIYFFFLRLFLVFWSIFVLFFSWGFFLLIFSFRSCSSFLFSFSLCFIILYSFVFLFVSLYFVFLCVFFTLFSPFSFFFLSFFPAFFCFLFVFLRHYLCFIKFFTLHSLMFFPSISFLCFHSFSFFLFSFPCVFHFCLILSFCFFFLFFFSPFDVYLLIIIFSCIILFLFFFSLVLPSIHLQNSSQEAEGEPHAATRGRPNDDYVFVKRTFNCCYFVLLPSLNRGRLRETSSFLFMYSRDRVAMATLVLDLRMHLFVVPTTIFLDVTHRGLVLPLWHFEKAKILLYWARFGGLRLLTLRWQPHENRYAWTDEGRVDLWKIGLIFEKPKVLPVLVGP